ncbi:Dephospho-CoA kinase [Andreprevotia sp. IGB-42]|uniref:dephospho-CoA kinase n=1 Tax=Andreprevotia sp. IGB-42 TaxID=2497473 RepID=UPI001356BB56|nr:dephospho-CoA kinase [Andreprevotia sp. IGB-42]KAF0811892.1 Dephospho-CoA kinase [Andreprevotia sp. IGB-42]
MRIIGLTGGIGSGKSTVAELFAQHGVPVIDTDQIAHALTRPPSTVLDDIASTFGRDFIAGDGSLRRDLMRDKVFGDPAARQALEAIMHPAIHAAVVHALQELAPETAYAIVVVPLLFETGDYSDIVERVLVVDCGADAQLARVLLRPGLTPAIAAAIMAQQWTSAQRVAAADDVIDNRANLQSLADQVDVAHQQYRQWANADEGSLTKRVFKT